MRYLVVITATRYASPADIVLLNGHPSLLRGGEMVFLEGDPSQLVYACKSGEIQVFVTTPSGKTLVLGSKREGQIFGELSAIDGGGRSAATEAITDSVVVSMRAKEFLEALRDQPHLAIALLEELSGHLRRANARTSARNSSAVPMRVSQKLLELDRQLVRHSGTSTPRIKITHEDLGSWVGATREAATRALTDLRNLGLVDTGRGWVSLRNPDELVDWMAQSQ